MTYRIPAAVLIVAVAILSVVASPRADLVLRGTGDMGIIIERAAGSIQVIETTGGSAIGRIEGLGDLIGQDRLACAGLALDQ